MSMKHLSGLSAMEKGFTKKRKERMDEEDEEVVMFAAEKEREIQRVGEKLEKEKTKEEAENDLDNV